MIESEAMDLVEKLIRRLQSVGNVEDAEAIKLVLKNNADRIRQLTPSTISIADTNQGWIRFSDQLPEIGKVFNWRCGTYLFKNEEMPERITRFADGRLERDDGRPQIVRIGEIDRWFWRYESDPGLNKNLDSEDRTETQARNG